MEVFFYALPAQLYLEIITEKEFVGFVNSSEMERGAKQAGVKKIRVHDIRHSAVSLLIDMGFSVLAIGERMGHEAEKITYRYAHLFPTVQTEMAEKLEMERMTKEDTNGKNT